MKFADPGWLYLLLVLPVLAGLGLFLAGRRRRALSRFAGGPGNLTAFRVEVDVHRRAVKALLLLVAGACLVVAVAGPQWRTRLESVTRQGVDIVVVLDTSLSMAAEDVAPSRFELARHGASSLIRKLSGDRVALVTFAGRAALSCPLTLDQEAARLFLDAIDLEAAPVAGTSLAEGIETAVRAFGEVVAVDEERDRVVVLYTDGEDHEDGLERALESLRAAGTVVYAVGVGTVEGGPIPVRDDSGTVTGYKKDREGKIVTTRLDEGVLEDLAVKTGGGYYRASAAGLEIDAILESISGLDAAELGTVLRARYDNRYQIPLLIALLALCLEAVLGDRRPRPAVESVGEGYEMIRTVLGVILMSGLTLPLGGAAYRKNEEGKRQYEDGDYAEALRAFTEAQVDLPDSPELFYNIGDVLYREGDHAGAEEAFARALRSAPPRLRGDAAYNLGNTLFEQKSYQEAAEAYTRALENAPDDLDAKRNLELALRLLEAQQQPQQPQQQPQQQDGEQGDDPQEQPQPRQSDDDDPRKDDPQSSSGPESGDDPEQPQDKPQPRPETEMTREQAQQLLDSISDQERENLHRKAVRETQRGHREVEKDW